MKTFKDIKFEPHPAMGGLIGRIFFDNGYGASIIRLKYYGLHISYTRNEDEWELAVLKGNEKRWDLANGDVIGYLTGPEVNKHLKQIQNMKGEQMKAAKKKTKKKTSKK